jgi:hypothetical protein
LPFLCLFEGLQITAVEGKAGLPTPASSTSSAAGKSSGSAAGKDSKDAKDGKDNNPAASVAAVKDAPGSAVPLGRTLVSPNYFSHKPGLSGSLAYYEATIVSMYPYFGSSFSIGWCTNGETFEPPTSTSTSSSYEPKIASHISLRVGDGNVLVGPLFTRTPKPGSTTTTTTTSSSSSSSTQTLQTRPFCPRVNKGDVVGTGFQPETGRVFFTLNGKFLGWTKENDFDPKLDTLTPLIRTHAMQDTPALNFGLAPFKFTELPANCTVRPDCTLVIPPTFASRVQTVLFQLLPEFHHFHSNYF